MILITQVYQSIIQVYRQINFDRPGLLVNLLPRFWITCWKIWILNLLHIRVVMRLQCNKLIDQSTVTDILLSAQYSRMLKCMTVATMQGIFLTLTLGSVTSYFISKICKSVLSFWWPQMTFDQNLENTLYMYLGKSNCDGFHTYSLCIAHIYTISM